MKKYNVDNYVRYKKDAKETILKIKHRELEDYSKQELVVMFMPLVEHLAKKFSTSQQVCGILTINDLIQEGFVSLIAAVNNVEREYIVNSEDKERTMKSFLSKRIKGGIRRAINYYKSNIKVPEYILNEENISKDKEKVYNFFISVFRDEDNNKMDDPYDTNQYRLNESIFNTYLDMLLKKHLLENQYYIITRSYGIGCKKLSAKEIAKDLGINLDSAHIRISQIKKDSIQILVNKVSKDQILDLYEEKIFISKK